VAEAITWQLDHESMGVTALCVADAAGMLAAFCPSMFTIRTFGGGAVEGANTAESIHIGMVLGSAISLLVGLGGTLVTRSWWPLAGTVIGLIFLCGAYEWALRNPHNTHKGLKDQ
jgi:hypothetical protein